MSRRPIVGGNWKCNPASPSPHRFHSPRSHARARALQRSLPLSLSLSLALPPPQHIALRGTTPDALALRQV